MQLNEIFAGSLLDERSDWIELRNAEPTAIALDGWVIEDQYTGDAPKEVPGRYVFPEGVTLCGFGYLILERADACEARSDTFDFGLGSTDGLVLLDAAGAVLDEASWQNLPESQSAGRPEEGAGGFARLLRPTPGYTNAAECQCCGECLTGRCTLRDGKCVATSEADCLESEACSQLGWCALREDTCVATDASQHCAPSKLCERRGMCGLLDGACVVVADADCRASKLCENEGRCAADLTRGVCVAVSAADCAASDDCIDVDRGLVVGQKNRCVLQGDRCVATGCEDASVCRDKMCCDLVDGKCVRL